MDMSNQEVTLCASNAYNKKFYLPFEPAFPQGSPHLYGNQKRMLRHKKRLMAADKQFQITHSPKPPALFLTPPQSLHPCRSTDIPLIFRQKSHLVLSQPKGDIFDTGHCFSHR